MHYLFSPQASIFYFSNHKAITITDTCIKNILWMFRYFFVQTINYSSKLIADFTRSPSDWNPWPTPCSKRGQNCDIPPADVWLRAVNGSLAISAFLASFSAAQLQLWLVLWWHFFTRHTRCVNLFSFFEFPEINGSRNRKGSGK